MAATAALLCTDAATAQRPATRNHDREMIVAWNKTCEHIRDGESWLNVASEVENILEREGPAITIGLIQNQYDSILRAVDQAPGLPKNGADVSDEGVVALLMESRLPVIQSENGKLIYAPLHLQMGRDGNRELHWDAFARQEEFEYTEPAVRILKRGRRMIPHLIAALDDRTATRCTNMTKNTNIPSMVFRRCDIAMALLEAMSRCKFYTADRNTWFSDLDKALRDETTALARQWWEETQSLGNLESRSWLIRKINYAQANRMIELMILDNETARAIAHLRELLDRCDNVNDRMNITQRLATLGDLSGVRRITESISASENISNRQADIMIRYGGRSEFDKLSELIEADFFSGSNSRKSNSRVILIAAATRPAEPMSIPLLALALTHDDNDGPLQTSLPTNLRQNLPATATRADMSAYVIQEHTRRDFRFDPDGSPVLRKKAIGRVRDWWQDEGWGLYGFQSSALRRQGGIR